MLISLTLEVSEDSAMYGFSYKVLDYDRDTFNFTTVSDTECSVGYNTIEKTCVDIGLCIMETEGGFGERVDLILLNNKCTRAGCPLKIGSFSHRNDIDVYSMAHNRKLQDNFIGSCITEKLTKSWKRME